MTDKPEEEVEEKINIHKSSTEQSLSTACKNDDIVSLRQFNKNFANLIIFRAKLDIKEKILIITHQMILMKLIQF